MPAKLKASELPVYRTEVGKSSEITAPSGPYVRSINARPDAIITTAPAVPAVNIGAISKAKKGYGLIFRPGGTNRYFVTPVWLESSTPVFTPGAPRVPACDGDVHCQ